MNSEAIKRATNVQRISLLIKLKGSSSRQRNYVVYAYKRQKRNFIVGWNLVMRIFQLINPGFIIGFMLPFRINCKINVCLQNVKHHRFLDILI